MLSGRQQRAPTEQAHLAREDEKSRKDGRKTRGAVVCLSPTTRRTVTREPTRLSHESLKQIVGRCTHHQKVLKVLKVLHQDGAVHS